MYCCKGSTAEAEQRTARILRPPGAPVRTDKPMLQSKALSGEVGKKRADGQLVVQ